MVKDGELGHGSRTIPSVAIVNRRPKLSIVAPTASPEEAAAVVAALERFMRETAPAPIPPRAPPRNPWQRAALNPWQQAGPNPWQAAGPNPWQQAALHEGVTRVPGPPLPWM